MNLDAVRGIRVNERAGCFFEFIVHRWRYDSFDIDSALSGDAARLHHHVIIDRFCATHPGLYFFGRATQSQRQLLVARVKSLVAQLFQQGASFGLISAAVVHWILFVVQVGSCSLTHAPASLCCLSPTVAVNPRSCIFLINVFSCTMFSSKLTLTVFAFTVTSALKTPAVVSRVSLIFVAVD